VSEYHEQIQNIRLLQLLCTNPYTINHTLMNLQQFCYIVKMIKRLNDCLSNCALSDDGPVRPETCRSWHIKALLWSWQIMCICWFTVW